MNNRVPAPILLLPLITFIVVLIVMVAANQVPDPEGWRCLRYSPLDGECVLMERQP